jgi:hypothetical protein
MHYRVHKRLSAVDSVLIKINRFDSVNLRTAFSYYPPVYINKGAEEEDIANIKKEVTNNK